MHGTLDRDVETAKREYLFRPDELCVLSERRLSSEMLLAILTGWVSNWQSFRIELIVFPKKLLEDYLKKQIYLLLFPVYI